MSESAAEPRYWFRRRSRGYGSFGWTLPATWEGWVVYAAHVVVVVVTAAFAPPAVSLVVLVLATIAVIVMAAKYGEPPAAPTRGDESDGRST